MIKSKYRDAYVCNFPGFYFYKIRWNHRVTRPLRHVARKTPLMSHDYPTNRTLLVENSYDGHTTCLNYLLSMPFVHALTKIARCWIIKNSISTKEIVLRHPRKESRLCDPGIIGPRHLTGYSEYNTTIVLLVITSYTKKSYAICTSKDLHENSLQNLNIVGLSRQWGELFYRKKFVLSIVNLS